MKAVQINKYGGSNVLEVVSDAVRPVPSESQILVEVYAASLNPFDYKVREGYVKDRMPLNFPATLGGDYAGKVVESKSSEFKVGDDVYGSALIFNGGSGSLAEFAVANVANSERKPNIDFIGAASLPLVGSSAIQAIEEHINLGKGQKILIHGGAGGIGSIAIQLAKLRGGYVATTVSTPDVEFAKSLGADEVIDYKKQEFEQIIKNYDAVFDTVGGEVTEKSYRVLKKGGILVGMVVQEVNEQLANELEIKVIGQFTKASAEKLQRLAELVDNEQVKPQVDKVFPLEEVKEAFNYLEKVHPRGKVVVKIKP